MADDSTAMDTTQSQNNNTFTTTSTISQNNNTNTNSIKNNFNRLYNNTCSEDYYKDVEIIENEEEQGEKEQGVKEQGVKEKDVFPPPPPRMVTHLNGNDIITYSFKRKSIRVPRKIYVDQRTIRDCNRNGIIFSAYDIESREKVIVKKLMPSFFTNRPLARSSIRDLQFKQHFDGHPNIAPFKGVFKLLDDASDRVHDTARDDDISKFVSKKDQDIYFVTSKPHTTLYQLVRLQPNKGLNENLCRILMYQLLRVLKFIHSAGVVHRDLDTKTIYVEKDCTLKLADLGNCFPIGTQTDLFLEDYGAQWAYRSPETIVLMKDYTTAIDIWSAGCIFGEMLLGSTLFSGTPDHLKQMVAISKLIGKPSIDECKLSQNNMARDFILRLPNEPKGGIKKKFEKASPEAIEVLEGMLCFDPSKRWTLDQLFSHRFFEEIYSPSDIFTCSNKFEKIDFEFFRLKPYQLKNLLERDFQEQA